MKHMHTFLRSFILCSLFSILCSVPSILNAADKPYVPGELIVKVREVASTTNTILSTSTEVPSSVKQLARFLNVKEMHPVLPDELRRNVSDAVETRAFKTFAEMKHGQRLKAIRQNGMDRIYRFTFPGTEDLTVIARELQKDPGVEFAEPNYIFSAFITPNDPYYTGAQQWYINKISCPAGWDITTGSAAVIIAVIDTGVSVNHQDLASKLMAGWNFVNNNANVNDGNGHGTMCAGIIAASSNNSVGITGINWNATIMPIKGLSDAGDGTAADLTNAILYAVANGADVISMSFGSSYSSFGMEGAIRSAYDANVVCVAAMGNDGGSTIYYPAGYSQVIRVGATDESDQRASFSTYGKDPSVTELTAPGTNITSTYRDGYASGSGTSFAAPIVSGLAGLILAKQPSINVSDLRILLHVTAVDLGAAGADKFYGFGRVNVENALKGIQTGGKGDEISQLMNFPNPAQDGTTFSFYLDDVADITIKVFTPHGELIKTIDGGVTSGKYHRVYWDCKDDMGQLLPNGTYFYVVIATGGSHAKIFKKGVMAILK